jgi:hypothetical protein
VTIAHDDPYWSARVALVRTAIALENDRDTDGSYPEEPSLPEDPFALDHAPMHYERSSSGRGWRLWSVSYNHRDDHGEHSGGESGTDDMLLERRP